MASSRVLVIDENAAGAALTKRVLETAGFEVHAALLQDPSLDAVLQKGWDVVLTEWGTPTAKIIAEVRRRGPAHPCLVIVASTKPISSTIDAAFVAGADDYLTKPCSREELIARARQAPRVRVAAASKTATSAYTRLGCWGKFAETTLVCLRDTFGRELEAIAPLATDFAPRYASSLTLSLPTASTEFRLAIEVETPAIQAIATAVMGEANEAIFIDIMKEMANAVGGSFMHVGLAESVNMTTSLPSSVDVAGAATFLQSSDARTSCWLRDSESKSVIALHLGIRTRQNSVVTVGGLKEGMVLAQDLLTNAGALLLKAGTRITATSSERVAKILGADVGIEVADCAA